METIKTKSGVLAVEVVFDINEKGYTENAKIFWAYPHLKADAKALKAVSLFRYVPSMRYGKPVKTLGVKVRLLQAPFYYEMDNFY